MGNILYKIHHSYTFLPHAPEDETVLFALGIF